MSVLYALAAAGAFATLAICVTRGLRNNSLMTALLVSLPVGAGVTASFMLFNMPPQVSIRVVGIFVAAGILGEGVGRTSFIAAVARLGPSTATPIQTATYPVFALLGGLLLFSEPVTLWRVVGAGSIAAGIWALVSGKTILGAPGGSARGNRRWRWAYLLPVLGGLAFAVSDLVRKLGLAESPYPALGAVVGAVSMTLVWGLLVLTVPRIRSEVTFAPGWKWFLPAGLLAGLGVLSVFNALDTGDVSVVGPIIMAQPLIVIMLSAVFLRDIERLTWRIAAGATLTVLGVILLALTSG